MLLNLNVDKVNIKDKLKKYPKNIQTVKKAIAPKQILQLLYNSVVQAFKKKIIQFFLISKRDNKGILCLIVLRKKHML